MHWIYILLCEGWNEELGLRDKDKRNIYIGETRRLFRRLKEHCGGDWGNTVGSVTTDEYRPIRLLGLYKVEDEGLFAFTNDSIAQDMYETGYLTENKRWALEVEDKITLQYMKAMGRKWAQVFGGRWHSGHPRNINPSKDFTIDRPYCNCKHPADIKEYNGKKYWRCSQKNFCNWDEMTIFLEEIGLQTVTNPCNYYHHWKEHDTFDECIIYQDENTIQFTGQCLIDSDEE